MTQITDPISSVAAYVAYSTNGSSWTDISGVASKVEPEESTRKSSSKFTFDGDIGLVTFGKREPFKIKISLVYSEANAALDALADLHETDGGGAIYIRWIPAGDTAGKIMYATPATKISAWNYPSIDAESGDPLMFEFTVGPVPSLTRSAFVS